MHSIHSLIQFSFTCTCTMSSEDIKRGCTSSCLTDHCCHCNHSTHGDSHSLSHYLLRSYLLWQALIKAFFFCYCIFSQLPSITCSDDHQNIRVRSSCWVTPQPLPTWIVLNCHRTAIVCPLLNKSEADINEVKLYLTCLSKLLQRITPDLLRLPDWFQAPT